MTSLALVTYGARETKAATITTGAVVAYAGLAFTHTGTPRRITITAGANPVRITWSATDPTATLGHYIAANENYVLDGVANIANLRMLALTGNSVITATIEN